MSVDGRQAIIEIADVTKSYSSGNVSVDALRGVSFSVSEGEFVAIMGPSGSGKTLLLRAVADLDPSDGAVSLDGEDRLSVPAPDWRQRVSYVAAEPGWWAATPADHISDWRDAVPLAEALHLSPDLGRAPIAQLSTGERQRFALIRTLVNAPAFLLLNEPTGPLDATTTEATERVLQARLDAGTGILLVTHDADQAKRLSDRILLLGDGKAEMRAA